jgi:hypothetical protein
MTDERTPPDVREGVRSGIYAAIERDVEKRGGRTARLLAAAGLVGVLGAIGLVLLVSRHPYGHHPSWHAVVFGAVWSGLLVVNLAFALLRVRTPSLPLARSASVALVGLGVAGVCGAVCPDPHFFSWWSSTPAGAAVGDLGGLAASALCFGLVSALFVGALAAFLVLGDAARSPIRPFLPALLLLLLLAPGVALQSVGTSAAVFAGWLTGTGAGAYLGDATGTWTRSAFARNTAV